jgi:hypothetical protein
MITYSSLEGDYYDVNLTCVHETLRPDLISLTLDRIQDYLDMMKKELKC